MPSHQANERSSLQAEMAGWSQPLIIDQINHHYFSLLKGRWELARELALLHYRIWRHVMNADAAGAALERHKLDSALRAAGLDAASADAADRLVIDELMDVIVRRFQRSPALSRAYGVSLLNSAQVLTQARLAS